ncbi:hypothetical protein H9P43_008718 [Blastocladiella emersonii ATCC 22665]|nr:hypothetical protein H9P43_008718 [Blastocladiella emersonii ATCC 22665]
MTATTTSCMPHGAPIPATGSSAAATRRAKPLGASVSFLDPPLSPTSPPPLSPGFDLASILSASPSELAGGLPALYPVATADAVQAHLAALGYTSLPRDVVEALVEDLNDPANLTVLTDDESVSPGSPPPTQRLRGLPAVELSTILGDEESWLSGNADLADAEDVLRDVQARARSPSPVRQPEPERRRRQRRRKVAHVSVPESSFTTATDASDTTSLTALTDYDDYSVTEMGDLSSVAATPLERRDLERHLVEMGYRPEELASELVDELVDALNASFLGGDEEEASEMAHSVARSDSRYTEHEGEEEWDRRGEQSHHHDHHQQRQYEQREEWDSRYEDSRHHEGSHWHHHHHHGDDDRSEHYDEPSYHHHDGDSVWSAAPPPPPQSTRPSLSRSSSSQRLGSVSRLPPASASPSVTSAAYARMGLRPPRNPATDPVARYHAYARAWASSPFLSRRENPRGVALAPLSAPTSSSSWSVGSGSSTASSARPRQEQLVRAIQERVIAPVGPVPDAELWVGPTNRSIPARGAAFGPRPPPPPRPASPPLQDPIFGGDSDGDDETGEGPLPIDEPEPEPEPEEMLGGWLVPVGNVDRGNHHGCVPLPGGWKVPVPPTAANNTDPASPPWIAVVQRGGCAFVDKVRAMQRSGASGVVVGDEDTGPGAGLVTMYAGGDTSDVTVPAVFIGFADYTALTSAAVTEWAWLVGDGADDDAWTVVDVILAAVVAPLILLVGVYALCRACVLSATSGGGNGGPSGPPPPATSPRVLASLPVRTFYAAKCHENDATMCVICLDEFVDEDEMHELPCTHRFHCACIETWLRDRKNVCPICRFELVEEEDEDLEMGDVLVHADAAADADDDDDSDTTPLIQRTPGNGGVSLPRDHPARRYQQQLQLAAAAAAESASASSSSSGAAHPAFHHPHPRPPGIADATPAATPTPAPARPSSAPPASQSTAAASSAPAILHLPPIPIPLPLPSPPQLVPSDDAEEAVQVPLPASLPVSEDDESGWEDEASVSLPASLPVSETDESGWVTEGSEEGVALLRMRAGE